MRRGRRQPAAVILALAFFWALPVPAWSYTSIIALEMEDVWQAALEVLTPHGISDQDKGKWLIKSEWIEDSVKRRRPLIPFSKKGPTTEKTYQRRYRLYVQLSNVSERCQVKIWGRYQQKSYSQSDKAPWTNIKPRTEDFDMERLLFFDILKNLENKRTAL